MAVVWNVFLERINELNVQIQASTVDLITVTDLYESFRKFFVDQRENFIYFEEKAMELSVPKQYTKDLGKRQRRHTRRTKDSTKKLVWQRVILSGLILFL